MDDLTAERYRPAESERPKSASTLRLLAEIAQRRRILIGKDELRGTSGGWSHR